MKLDVTNPPLIIFSAEALRWMKAMVEVHTEEIGWFGIVDKIRRNDADAYYVRRIIYPKHCLVTGSTCEISPEGEAEMAQDLLTNTPDDFAKMKLWGHSHVHMQVSPSNQDEEQAERWVRDMLGRKDAYFIRVICNKKGEIGLQFLDLEHHVKFDHVQYRYENDAESPELDKCAEAITAVLRNGQPKGTQMITIGQILNLAEKAIEDAEKEKYEVVKKKVEDLKAVNLPKPSFQSNYPQAQDNRATWPRDSWHVSTQAQQRLPLDHEAGRKRRRNGASFVASGQSAGVTDKPLSRLAEEALEVSNQEWAEMYGMGGC